MTRSDRGLLDSEGARALELRAAIQRAQAEAVVAHLLPLQGHVTGTCLPMMIVKLIMKKSVCRLAVRAKITGICWIARARALSTYAPMQTTIKKCIIIW